MEYRSKGYNLDNEVHEWLSELKAKYGSYNKGLRVLRASVPFGATAEVEATVSPDVAILTEPITRMKKLAELRGRTPLLKPSERKK